MKLHICNTFRDERHLLILVAVTQLCKDKRHLLIFSSYDSATQRAIDLQLHYVVDQPNSQ